MQNNIKPEWTPDDAGTEFASFVMPGISDKESAKNRFKTKIKKQEFSVQEYVDGILSKNLTLISKAITLTESNSAKHIEKAQEVLKGIFPHTGKSIRIGITGAPGAGKSTFIEEFGSYLCSLGLRVAVLAIDPSSTLSKGSILGDKTRMEKLSREPNAFIRPSPSAGTLGGVARKTRETILICEAAGYDVILIETIGVGQSEITVRSMVDFFMLVIIPGSGDELQGIKKGVVELADMLVVNKADGDNIQRANLTKHQYAQALQMLLPATEGWKTTASTCSAITGMGIDNIWSEINRFVDITKRIGVFDNRRRQQLIEWVQSMIESEILDRFYSDSKVSELLPNLKTQVLAGNTTPTSAVNILLESFFSK